MTFVYPTTAWPFEFLFLPTELTKNLKTKFEAILDFKTRVIVLGPRKVKSTTFKEKPGWALKNEGKMLQPYYFSHSGMRNALCGYCRHGNVSKRRQNLLVLLFLIPPPHLS